MNKIKVAINGFGRIGRMFYRLASQDESLDIVAINDLGDKNNLKYLLEHDSVYKHFNDSKFDSINFFSEKDPEALPWGELGIEIVVESTGFFRTEELASKHIKAGAKRVVVSAPSKDIKTILMGVNTEELKDVRISSNASCTTNAISPIVSVINEKFGIKKAVLNTIHSYTSTQRTVDSVSNKDYRRGRAAAINIIPTSTGAALATAKVHTFLENKFHGMATRVPTPSGSLIDLTILLNSTTDKEELNKILKEASESDRWSGILAYSEEELVSSDIIGRTEASIVDAKMTMVIDGDLVKVLSWYDNEAGYTNTLLMHVKEAAKYL